MKTIHILTIIILLLLSVLIFYIAQSKYNGLFRFHINTTERIDFTQENDPWGSYGQSRAFSISDSDFLGNIPLNVDLSLKEYQIFHMDIISGDTTKPNMVAIVGKPEINYFTGKGKITFKILHEVKKNNPYYLKLKTVHHNPPPKEYKCYNSLFEVDIDTTNNYARTLDSIICPIKLRRIRSGHLSDIVFSHREPKPCPNKFDNILLNRKKMMAGEVRICKVIFGR